MKTKMICLHCGHTFDTDEVVCKYYDRATGTYDREECPNCVSEDIEEGMECCVCNEVHREEDMIGEVCKECFDKAVTFGNALRYGKERKEAVVLHGFLTWCFSEDEIESILLKNLQEQSPEWRKRMADEYCTDDKYDFAEFLEERGAEE